MPKKMSRAEQFPLQASSNDLAKTEAASGWEVKKNLGPIRTG
jgi:hypothetical protein